MMNINNGDGLHNENADNFTEKGKLIIISGSAGSGKSTVLKELFKLSDYKYSISATTRAPRDGEIDGTDYYFITEEDFLTKISNGEMLEYVEYSGNYYGTLKEPVEKMLSDGYNVILEIEVVGALNIKEKYPEALMIFLTPPNYFELEKRLRGRGTESEESINKRLDRAKKEVECINKYDYLILNESDMQKRTAFIINCVVETEKHKLTKEKTTKFLKDYFS